MSIKLYLVRTHKIGTTNILTALLTETLGDQIYYPCFYSLSGKHVINHEGEFTSKFPGSRIRDTIWHSPNSNIHLNYLDDCLYKASIVNKVVTLGCHDNQSINFLAKKYSPEILTTCIFYDENEYDKILKQLAEYHVFNLGNGIEPTEHDSHLMKELSFSELTNYYIDSFDKHNLIPKFTDPVCQYNLKFSDLFYKNKVIKFFDSMNIPLTPKALKFYESWLSAYSDL